MSRKPGCFEPFIQDADSSEDEKEDDNDDLAGSIGELGSQYDRDEIDLYADIKIEMEIEIEHEIYRQKPEKPIRGAEPRISFSRTRKLPRYCLPKHTVDQIREFEDQNVLYASEALLQDRAASNPGVLAGVAEIFKTSSGCEIHTQLWPGTKPSYNFSAYRCSNMVEPRGDTTRTVKSREAEGSLDPE
ncbi:hypothetical protein DL769_003649 [Monosporascus sp. CRB-8-3]|nr:hypothetical protein DL769_003649 [Monosporascus sp. CRB-8-3]